MSIPPKQKTDIFLEKMLAPVDSAISYLKENHKVIGHTLSLPIATVRAVIGALTIPYITYQVGKEIHDGEDNLKDSSKAT